jgi:AraC-like DNA-binding protein
MQVSKEHITHPGSSLRFLRFELDAFRAPRHVHRHVELTWIESGFGLRLVGDDASTFAAGDLVLLGPQVPHTWATTGTRQRPRPAASVLQFEPEWITQSPWPELARAAPLLADAQRGLRIGGRCARAVTEQLTRMREAGDHERLAGLILIVGALLAHPRDLKPIATQRAGDARARGTQKDAGPRRIDRVIDWLQRHLTDELRVDDAARLAHVTPAAFSRWFRREVGKTFTQYVNDLRFGATCVQLRQSDRPIATIAADCGFATMSHFNRQFRLRAGMTPREYRAAT